jgi:hypothetical protein
MYYVDNFNFEILCSVINEIFRGDASSIAMLQEIFNDSNEPKVLGLHSGKFHFYVAVYNKTGKSHKFVVKNSKGHRYSS